MWFQVWRSLTSGHKSKRNKKKANQGCRQPSRWRSTVRLALEPLEDRIAPAAVSWTNPNGGDWDTAGNWSSGQVPGSQDDVTIPVLTAGAVVTHSRANSDSVNSITSSAPITLSAGTLAVTGNLQVSAGAAFTLQGGTLQNATIAAGTDVVFTSQGGTLDGVTANSDLDLASNNAANVHIVNNLTLNNATVYLGSATGTTDGTMYFANTETLGVVPGSTGAVVFGKSVSNAIYEASSSGTLTIGSGITVHGSNGTLGNFAFYSTTIINQGTIAADDSGGAVPGFAYDTGFNGGLTESTGATIDTSANNAAPSLVYQTARIGWNLAYTVPNLTPGASYTVRLHFAEWGSSFSHGGTINSAGQRVFNVSVNGAVVLPNFDIFAAAGATDKAVVEDVSGTADSNGQIKINFDRVSGDYPQVNGIQVLSGNTVVQAINSGEPAGGKITINPSTFQNQGTVLARSGGTLTLSPGTFAGGVLEADRGGLIKINGDITFSPSTQINVQVSSITPGGYGQIAISGNAALNGTLNVLAGNGLTMNAGDSINVMTFASHTDNFTMVKGTSFGRFTFFSETVGDTAVMLTATTAVEDLSATSVTFDPTGTPGENVNVSYTVTNLSDVAVSGDWFDSLYLTQGTTLDASAVLLTRVERTTTVAANGGYTVNLIVPVPGVLPGDYHVILFVDSRGLLPEADRNDKLLVSADTMQVTVPSLSLGDSVTGTISSGQNTYYSVNIPAGHDVVFTTNSNVPGAAELFVRYAYVPSPSSYDQFAFNPKNQKQLIGLSGATQGTYFILLQGQQVSAGGQPFALTVEDAPFSLVGVSAAQADTGKPFTAILSGFQFTPQTTAALVSSTGTQIAAQSVTYLNRNTLYATFEVPLFEDGIYGVQVARNGVTSTLSNVITAATQPNSAQATFSMSAPQYVRSTSHGTITISYENDTGHDIPAPLLNVTANNALLRLPDQPSFISNKAEFLGINTNGPAGVLPPGARGQITIFFQVNITDSTSGVFFNLYPSLDYYNIGDVGTTQFNMDWASVKDELRPSTFPVAAWDAVWSNFLASVGSNVAEFHDRLDIDANYLSQFGEYQYDIGPLMSFELLRANDFLPGPTLASAVDVPAPTRAEGLSFSRQYLQPISGRDTLGTLGYGWVSNWDASLTVDGQGNVTIMQVGQPAYFTLHSNGSYQSGAGDTRVLTLSGGIYQLAETDGDVLAFDSQGRLAYAQDSSGERETARYTENELTSLTDSSGLVLKMAYNSNGRISQVTDPGGQVTTYTYDASGNHLLSCTGPQGTTSYTYVTGHGIAQENALASITFPDGTHHFFSYDSQGRLVSTSRDGGAEPMQYAYTSPGGVTRTDAAGDTTTRFYNEFGSLVTMVDPLGNTTQDKYNANQNLTQVITAVGTSYHYSYDQNGNLIGGVNPLGATVSMTYNSSNDLTSVTDANGNTTRYFYNSSGDLTSTIYADGSSTQASYNNIGLPTSTTDARGQVIAYQYNAAGQVTLMTFADGTQQSFTYDARGNLVITTDAAGTTTYTYNTADELTSVAYPSGQSLLYSYNAGGQRTQLVDATSGFTVNYNYDSLGRLQSLADANGNTLVTYKYDNVGRLAEQDNANGTHTTYSYDADSNLLHLINYGPGGVIQSRFDYTYNALNQRTGEATLDGTWTYTYDGAGQLIHAVLTSTNPAVPSQDLSYVYDAAGNRTRTVINSVTTNYTTNNRNEYTTVGGTTYQYDADGNLISMTDTTGTTTFTYNSLNQLVKAVTPTDAWVYQYNALGQRISAAHNGQKIAYVLDPSGIGNVIAAYDSSGNPVADYGYGLGLAIQDGPIGVYYYQFNAIGSTVGMSNSTGAVANSYSYDPFGNSIVSAQAVANPFQFVGQWGVATDGSGLDHMSARDYNPISGIFTTVDPLGIPQPTVYSYAQNNPLRFIDPSGRCANNIVQWLAQFVLYEMSHGGDDLDRVGDKAAGHAGVLTGMGDPNEQLPKFPEWCPPPPPPPPPKSLRIIPYGIQPGDS